MQYNDKKMLFEHEAKIEALIGVITSLVNKRKGRPGAEETARINALLREMGSYGQD